MSLAAKAHSGTLQTANKVLHTGHGSLRCQLIVSAALCFQELL